MKPFIFQLPTTTVDLVNESNIIYSTSSIFGQPLFKYGFHHFINQPKDKLVILDTLEGKTFYNIIEQFNDDVPNYSDSIKNKVNLKRNKLELWEVLSIFGLEGDLYCNDEEYDDVIKSFYSKNSLKYKIMDDYKKTDIYININKSDANIKQLEQGHFPILLEALHEIGEGLNKNGNCIIKVYDTYTEVSIKLLKLMSEIFTETYVYKPYITYGRQANKYIIGLNYKGNFKNSSKFKEILSEIKSEKLNNIFNNIAIPEQFEFVVKYMNIQLGNYEHKMTNILVDYIKKSNYFGDLYHESLEKQKKSSEYWLDIFYSSNYKKNKETLASLISKTIKDNNDDMIQMFKSLV